MTIRRTFTFLGTGTSVGIPMVGCDCEVCRSPDPRNHRYRASVAIANEHGNLIIDTGPELRLQLIRAGIKRLHGVLYTHYHADHLFGLDDVRPFPKYMNAPVPLYCTAEVEDRIRHTFHYAFREDTPESAYLPKLVFHRVDENVPFLANGEHVIPIPLEHAQFRVLGFRIGDVAYCTDVSAIPPQSWPRLQGLRVLVLDALRYKPHPAHLSINQALEIIDQLKPERAFLTHMSHDIDHETAERQLPAHVRLAFDGLAFDF